MALTQRDLEEDVASEEKTEEPPMFRVYLLNDDYTTMDFVIFVLRHIFNKNDEEAVNIMLHVHRNGIGLCGVYSSEIAETKVKEVTGLARENGFPLQCKIEKEE
ncbi:MAG: ATP-dependent Clp protease adapter ClpS [Proteobacteria bacterium]|nr:ATP-dependent Clp protease adapter ClpS [Pseudomonadota bacterium]MBU4470169.1 ATP-dependent Clp protease adapter ClpS [Pseudomonadota bacterium]MCG2750466.1 ATP-dependent Clp protease adapter ClpS [Desulfobacteraceae bacterium]